MRQTIIGLIKSGLFQYQEDEEMKSHFKTAMRVNVESEGYNFDELLERAEIELEEESVL